MTALEPGLAPATMTAELKPEFMEILSPAALGFIALLARRFEPARRALLDRRAARQLALDGGEQPDFLPETAHIRSGGWSVGEAPADLRQRRVEITGPVDRKMMINALGSGADVFMADLEDSCAPTWQNCLAGQLNLRDAVRGTISYVSPEGKSYHLRERRATLVVRPRGWHLLERHLLVDGAPVSASLFDAGLYLFHNARALLERGSGPYFYLPKLESHQEARLWNDVFVLAEELLQLPRAAVKATVLIETVLAAFEMDEILYELRERVTGLNCGRWDYIFSAIKKFRHRPDFVLPDRSLVTMTSPPMRAYSLLAIQTCHRRNAYAIGGMAAQIPIKHDPLANEEALAKVRADKEREAVDGHDGTWVAHPGLVPVARGAFDAVMPGWHQIARTREDVHVAAADLLAFQPGLISEAGLRTNISIGIQYLAAWLGGSGCVPINNLMEDAATAEISRAQVWQWLRRPGVRLVDGRPITEALYRELLERELDALPARAAGQGPTLDYQGAATLFDTLTLDDSFIEFMTIPGYNMLIERGL